ncbi:hypothetical protein H2200_005056 [Cladophialophora chaetospira]|uniref:Lysophospholipase n=1 Tax=Cladophialophora chaetospira TaxID=386627 RepID=A0AA38XBW7_9EURO|nr:hypothetical protein H2200_005056 [Cladophialophora chaetospira]
MIFHSSFLVLTATTLGSLIHQSVGQAPYAKSYAPAYVQCPPNIEWVRPATGLSKPESAWVQGRKKVVLAALGAYLERLHIPDFNVSNYLGHMHASNFEDVPIMGLAISGGGWASAYTGTGALRALDARLPAAVQHGTGGLLQCMTYMSGLSGGSFPTVSFAVNGFPTADEIVKIWKPTIDRLGANQTTQYAATFTDMFKDLGAKMEAGFSVGTADLYGLIFGYEFTPGVFNVTLSGVVNETKFKNHEMPMPILQVIELTNSAAELYGLKVPVLNDTTYDLTPFEFGAWGGSASSFTPTQYLGTKLKNGVPMNESACVVGFDGAAYAMGMSAAAWNLWAIEAFSNGTEGSFSKAKRSIGSLMNHLQRREEIVPPATITEIDGAFQKALNLSLTEIAYAEIPNPFLGVSSASPYTQTATDLSLVDGSEGGQTIPLWGQIQPARKTSFIVAWEDSNDAHPYEWNNGTNLYNTYLAAKAANLPFPIIPPVSNFISHNYTTKPVFFGCDKKLTTTRDSRAPIVLYLANAPYSSYMNYSAGVNVMSPQQMNDIFVNSFNLVTQGNGTLDAEWPVCLGCAAIERSLEKAGMMTPAQCKSCFKRYCWDGKVGVGSNKTVDLSLVLDPKVGYKDWLNSHMYWNASLSHGNAV